MPLFNPPLTPDYIQRLPVAGQTLNNGTVILWATADVVRGLTYAAGQFLGLRAGRTYGCLAKIRITTSSWVIYQWYDVTAAAFIGGQGQAESMNAGANQSSGHVASSIITPTVATVLEVRCVSQNGTPDVNAISWARIIEVGS